MKKRLLILMILLVLLLGSSPAAFAASNIVIGGVDVGYAERQYFSTTGEPCSCHHKNICAPQKAGCTCIHVNGTAQCYAFALWCQNKMFGKNDVGSPKDFHSVGSIAAGSLTASNLKALLYGNKVPAGSHIRTYSGSKWQHSMVVMSVNENGFTIAQANADGHCQVSTKTYTWDSYVKSTYGPRGIQFVKVPNDASTVASCDCSDSYAGDYRCTTTSQNLIIRSGHGATGNLGSIPSGATVSVSKANGTWAHITYNGISGFASMQYLSKIPTNHVPIGFVDAVTGGNHTITVYGWAFDEDAPDAPLAIHVYVGGEAGSGAPCYPIMADQPREDIATAYGVGKNHGFYQTIDVGPTGTQEIYVYAINDKSGHNPLLGSETVTISDINLPPLTSSLVEDFYARIENCATGTVLTHSDTACGDGAYDAVFCAANGTEKQLWNFVKQGDGSYKILSAKGNATLALHVNNGNDGTNVVVQPVDQSISQNWFIHEENGTFYLHPACSELCCLDLPGASAAQGVSASLHPFNTEGGEGFRITYAVPGLATDLPDDFCARIENKVTGHVLACSEATPSEGYDAVFVSRQESAAQKWHFIRQSDGSYKICLLEDEALALHAADGGQFRAGIAVQKSQNTTSQRWFVHQWNGLYYLRPACCEGYVLDLSGASAEEGAAASLYPFNTGGGEGLVLEHLARQYTVFLNANGGEVSISSKAVTPGQTFGELPVPTRTGYTFAGWFTAKEGGTQIEADTVFTGAADLTLYAHWTKSAAGSTLTMACTARNIRPGQTFTVQVGVGGNPGVAALMAQLSYDESVLALTGIENSGRMATLVHADSFSSGMKLLWQNPTGDLTEKSAVLATLTFRVLDNAPLKETLLRFDFADDSSNYDEEALTWADSSPLRLTVSQTLLGDVNADGKVNSQDSVRLCKYLVGMDVAVDRSASDTNGDGKINSQDSIRLCKMLLGLI